LGKGNRAGLPILSALGFSTAGNMPQYHGVVITETASGQSRKGMLTVDT
jgi:hypothetical protein